MSGCFDSRHTSHEIRIDIVIEIVFGMSRKHSVKSQKTVAAKETNVQASVGKGLESAISQINHHPVDKCYLNLLGYRADSDLSNGWCYPLFVQLRSGW